MLKTKTKLVIAILTALMLVITGCGTKEDKADKKDSAASANYPKDVKENPVVTITMESGQEMTLELYPKTAPNTVANFISLIEKKYYDGLIFHRVIPDFMIQGGDPEGTGAGGPGYSIKGEFNLNDFKNDLKHERGVISMARTQEPDSAGSQFFIVVADYPSLDGEYAAFGKVTKGMETADAIAAVERDANDKPLQDQKIKSMTVDTKGYKYPQPEKVGE